MPELTKNEIIDYLQKAAEFEYGIYTMDKLKNRTQAQLDETRRKQQLEHDEKPFIVNTTKKYVELYELPDQEPVVPELPNLTMPLIIGGAVFIVAAILGRIFGELPLIGFLVKVCGAVLGLLAYAYAVVSVIKYTKIKKERKIKLVEYNDYHQKKEHNEKAIIENQKIEELNKEAVIQDQKTNAEANDKWEKEENEYKNALAVAANNEETLLQETTAKLDELTKQRDELYSQGVVYPTYQGLVPVCTMLEYFKSGRVDEFAGPNGAYNLYESELRQNIIIDNLNNINNSMAANHAAQSIMLDNLSKLNNSINDLTDRVGMVYNATEFSTAVNSGYLTNINNTLSKLNY